MLQEALLFTCRYGQVASLCFSSSLSKKTSMEMKVETGFVLTATLDAQNNSCLHYQSEVMEGDLQVKSWMYRTIPYGH